MDKIQTLKLIDKIKASHERQMHKLELLMSDKDVDSIAPLAKTECELGKLMYSNEDALRRVVGSLFYEKLDVIHEKWHNEYSNIFNIFNEYVQYKSTHKGLFSKLIGGKKVSDMDIDKAKLYYSELKLTTQELLHIIDVSRRRIAALAETKFN